MADPLTAQTSESTAGQRRLLDGFLLVAGVAVAAVIVAAALQGGGMTRTPADPIERVRRDPLDTVALRDLGLELDRQGKPERADALLSFVGARTWRDGPDTDWLLRRRLAQARFEDAFQRADSLLRRDGDHASRPALFPVLVKAAAYLDSRPALLASLREPRSDWRSDYLRELALKGDLEGARMVFVALAASSDPPGSEEYSLLINRLVAAGRYSDAMTAWREVSRIPTGDGLQPVDLSQGYDHTPFTWSEAEGVGGVSEVAADQEARGARVLRVDYDGFSTPLLPARMMVLSPGTYRLNWSERIDPGAAASLTWRVRCADTGQILAKTPPARGVGAWLRQELDFDAPAAGCAGQWLELFPIAGDRRDPVTARYADFTLSRR